MNFWHIKYIYDYGGYIIDGIYFYWNPYGYMYSKLLSKETLKQCAIFTYPYTKDIILAKLARQVPVKELELDELNNKDLIKHV